MRVLSVGRLRFLKPKPTVHADSRTSVPANVVTRIRNQTTTGRTIRPFVVSQ
jgi:hypothetical protein